MYDTAFLVPALPLAGFALLMIFGRRLGDPKAGWLGFGAIAASFLATLVVWLEMLTRDSAFRTLSREMFQWFEVGGLDIGASLLIDPLSITMALFVTGVSALIHLYSIGYMKGDPRFYQFFIYLNLFVFSMLMLVLGDNLLITFLGWEGVGVCSYFLIGFWFEKSSAATAAKKAFIVNRIGDAGLLLGIFLIFGSLGTLTYIAEDGSGFLQRLNEISGGTVTAAALLLFIGAIGKSAQLPLYVWLPDAMEGPTPVSALIHAATMVTAGVYLMVRVAPMLEISSTAAATVAIVGAASALFAALVACAQNDIKRVLAYSTMSQLGYMFLAVGAGAYTFGIFHMVTHAFFKALLFLSAGAVIHALHNQQDLKFMGGLRKFLPWTFGFLMVGWLSIAGVPPLSGFWSKDEILLSAFEYNKVLYVIALGTVLLTAYYMSRLFFMTFLGTDRWKKHASSHADAKASPHESPRTMLIPMGILAVASIFGGLLQVQFPPFQHVLEDFLDPTLGQFTHHADLATGTKWILALAGVAVAGVGIAIAALISRRNETWPETLEPKVLQRSWYVDTLYSGVFEKPGRAAASWNSSFVDNRVIDGAVNGSVRLIAVAGAGMRRLQTGYVRNYALTIAGGTVLVLCWAIARSAL
jgi:NADH-quinone oxidoreductase subunit L